MAQLRNDYFYNATVGMIFKPKKKQQKKQPRQLIALTLQHTLIATAGDDTARELPCESPGLLETARRTHALGAFLCSVP